MRKNKNLPSLFLDELEQESIERIRKFAKIAKTMKLEIHVGFSGGKDSQVIYDLINRSGIEFKAFFNHAFESSETLKFIRDFYPNVIWRREYKYGFIENIWKKHSNMLPTVYHAYCCQDYKHNPKYVDKCSVVGVRKAESAKRAKRTSFSFKNKTILKQNKEIVNKYFIENCQSIGTKSIIQLLPIVDWSDNDVWSYIYKYNLPINSEYKNGAKRVGCVVCPKASFSGNYKYLVEHPKLIDAFINAKSKNNNKNKIEWNILYDKKDYADDKPYYICRWLNHSFMPFTKKEEILYKKVRVAYDKINKNNN